MIELKGDFYIKCKDKCRNNCYQNSTIKQKLFCLMVSDFIKWFIPSPKLLFFYKYIYICERKVEYGKCCFCQFGY